MDNNYLHSYIQTKYLPPKSIIPKTPPSTPQTPFISKTTTKYLPSQHHSQIILNYFQFNNFQDFNTWQQIAKTKTDYTFDSKPIFGGQNNKIQCTLTFKWQNHDKQNITIKTLAKTQKTAKRKALLQLIQTLMSKGYITCGFKDKNFIEKLPRRKKYSSSSSDEDSTSPIDTNQSKRLSIYALIKQNKQNHQTAIIQNLQMENIFEAWNWALSKRNLVLIQKVLKTVFGEQLPRQSIQQEQSKQDQPYKQPALKQVSYVEQFKDPFEEDLTVFIRYYLLQRTKYQPKMFNTHQFDNDKSVPVNLCTKEFRSQVQNTTKFDIFAKFRSIQQISEHIGKKSAKSEVKVKSGFFEDLKNVLLPKFDQNVPEQSLLPIKTLEKMFNHLFYLSQDYPFALKALQLLESSVQNVQFLNRNTKKPENDEESSEKKFEINLKAKQYYKEMKKKILVEMLYNTSLKVSQQNLVKSNSIEGMLNVFSSHTRYDGLFLFTSKQPEQILAKKIQKKTNFNEFFEQYEFCTEEAVLLVNKISQKKYIGTIQELNQNFKIHIPFLLFDPEIDFPAPFTVYKLLNLKLFNKMSSSLIYVCKNYMKWIDPQLGTNSKVTLIYQTPSCSNLELIQELIAEFISQKLFVLIVSENYESLSKVLNEKGFKCLKVSMGADDKVASKHNIILANQLNICTDSMKSIAFDRVIIDESHRVPEIISLMSIVKCTKKLYLIGDPNLPRSEMKSLLSKENQTQKSLFEKYLENGSPYLLLKPTQPNLQQLSSNTQMQTQVYDNSITQWLKTSVYGHQLMTNLDVPVRKTPLIKGFNWPSTDYRLCFIDFEPQAKHQSIQILINQECFLIVWIIAQVLKSGFTDLQQITCCCIDSSIIPALQRHLIKILIKLGIQPLQWQIIFQKLIKPLNGSKWNKNDLIIVLAEQGSANIHKKRQFGQSYDQQLGKKLNSALLQAQRGLIIVGNMNKLSQKSVVWQNFMDWMASKRLIMSFKGPKQYIN